MLLAIFRKEFFKIQRYWLVVLSFNLCIMAWIGVSTRRLFIMDHAEIVWYRMLHLGQIHFENMMYIPLVTGILIACFQFLPEMRQERFRLSLHLPASPGKITMAYLLTGLFAYALTALADLLGLGLITAWYFPWEGVVISLITALPWTMAGACAYLGCALALLEPNLKLRAVNLCLGAGVSGLYMRDGMPGAYQDCLGILVLPLVLMAVAVLVPVLHFRYRRVG